MELHVWGPGFDLPSIDPECLAAITFFSIHLSPENWKLIHSSDPSVSPNRTLPALHHNSHWISGYDAIIRHVSSDESLLTRSVPSLTPPQGADLVAYGTFIRQHGAPLLALSLYISSANWVGATRPLYSRILRFPLPWTVPLSLRSRAHSAAAHLNLSGLDTDSVAPTHQDEKDHFQSSGTLQSLRSRVHAVTGSMTPDMKSHIRLDALASDFYTPLEALLKSTNMGKTFILSGGHPTALDCLAYGYLALMLLPELPRRFLADTMSRKHKELARFTTLMKNISTKGGELPVATYSPSILQVLARFLDGVADVSPVIGNSYVRWKRIVTETKLLGNSIVGWEAYDILHLGGQAFIAAVMGMTAVVYGDVLGFGPGPRGHRSWNKHKTGLSGRGEAGQMFDMAFQTLPPDVN